MNRDSLWDDPGSAGVTSAPAEPVQASVAAPPPVVRLRGHSPPAPQAAPQPAAAPAPRRRPRRLPARPRPLVVDLLALLAGLGLGITIALGVTAESAGSLRAAGGLATAGGRITGLVAAYAMVVVVVLVARFPPLERAVGQDRLVTWHRKLGPWPLYLLVAHGSLIAIGYARAAHDGLLHQLGQLLWTYPGILAGTVGGVLLVAAGVSSYRKARRRMAYETWWSVHLYTYLALFLSFSHQVNTGASFVGHDSNRFWWTALWVGTLALVVSCRVLLPLWRSVRHQVVVEAVVPEGPGTYSVILRGRRLDRLPVAGGQFLQWRFLRRGLWWQAHPYSLSAAPSPNHLRITVKDLGDHSHALMRLKPGTRVGIEGPYGAFTSDHRVADRVLLVGAGVGTTPIRALLSELPANVDIVSIVRAPTPDGIVLRHEIAQGVKRRGGKHYELVGSREEVRLTHRALVGLIPDLRQRDVYVCGPDGFTADLITELRAAGLKSKQIHHETFAF